MSKRRVDCLYPATIDNDCGSDERIKQWFDIGTTSSDVSAQRCANRRSGARGATGTQREHGAAERFRAKRFKRSTTSIDPINNNRGQGFTHGSFECCFPARIDFNEIENCAEDTVDAGKTFRASTRTRFVECKGKRFDSGAPSILFAFGGTMHCFGRLNR
jgi:hypothetical protein